MNLPEVNINRAIDTILARYEAVNDADGNKLFLSVGRGLNFLTGAEGIRVFEGRQPAIRIWEDRAVSPLDTIPNTERQVHHRLSLFVIFKHVVEHEDAQQFRNRLVDKAKRILWRPDDVGNVPEGTTPADNTWIFKIPQLMETDHTAPFKKFGIDTPLLPPWYCTRIDFDITVFPRQ